MLLLALVPVFAFVPVLAFVLVLVLVFMPVLVLVFVSRTRTYAESMTCRRPLLRGCYTRARC